MHYVDQWRALSARIHGLTEAIAYDERFFGTTNTGNWRFLGSQLRELIEQLAVLKNILEQAHSASAAFAIGRLLCLDRIHAIREGVTVATGELEIQTVRSCLVALQAFDAEMTFLFSDTQQSLRIRSERAFQHLIRQIAVDDQLRQRWIEAFRKHETQCEKLGAVHLLAHGIYAFKVDAKGARTDLVFAEPRESDKPEHYADALVLTEWKTANADSAKAKFDEAKSQAVKYAVGPLAGNELRSYRYAVVVTEKNVETPPDEQREGIVYRHINIAVEPDTPAVEARRSRRKVK